MPSIDVAVPCYQYGRFLRDCVTSVLSQGLQDVRVLIIDNASTDNSLDVARQLAAEDSRVKIRAHPTNIGHIASFNEGIDWASADYFKLLYADDLLAPGCLARAISIMEQYPNVNLTYGREFVITADDPIPIIDHHDDHAQWRVLPGRELLERLCRTGSLMNFVGTTALVRTSAQKRIGYFRAEFPHTADNEMWLRFASLGDVAETDAVQAIRRYHPLNLSALVTSIQWYTQFEATLESFFSREGASAPRRLRRVARRTLGEGAYWSAVATLLRGQSKLAVDLLKFAFTRCPTTMLIPPIGYLFRRDNTRNLIAQLLSEAARRVVVTINDVQGGR